MKYILFLLMMVNIVFAQMANGKNSSMAYVTGISGNLNLSGVNESYKLPEAGAILKGELIINLGNNEYWLKNSELTSASGDVYVFSESLLRNGVPVIDQVDAKYGYILVTTPGQKEAVAYIAGEKGSKASDPVEIKL